VTTTRADDHPSWWGDAIRGAVAGGVATWFMDLVTTGVQASQSREDAARELAARPNGQGSTANLVDLLVDRFDLDLDPSTRATASQAVHYALGMAPGAAYGIVRSRLPAAGAWRGMLYGLALFALNDEWLNAALDLSGPPDAYPASSHVRGAVGHVALGIVTDAGLDVLGASRPG